MSDITRVLSQIESGDPSAAEQLLPLVYEELRKLAAAKLAQEKPGQTLQATALVHEAYVRLVGSDRRAEPGSASAARAGQTDPAEAGGTYESRNHFFAPAAIGFDGPFLSAARAAYGDWCNQSPSNTTAS